MPLWSAVVLLASVGIGYGLPTNWELAADDAGHLRLIDTDARSIHNQLPEAEPLFVPETDIIFRLFTRANRDDAQIIAWNDPQSIVSSNFNANHPTRLIIHGWGGDEDANVLIITKDSYLNVGEFNVINVDWSAGAQTINYITARNHVGPVGEIVSRLVDNLIATAGIARRDITIIGSSLGAHAAGNAGKFQNGLVNTIIGLDPAGPLFSLGQSDILHTTDGHYVETIYTNAGLLGIDFPLGHSNFFPNGGRTQPGCGVDLAGNCSHMRAHVLFAESIVSQVGFHAVRCASHEEILTGVCTSSGPNAVMGGEPSNYGRGVNGVYHLTTNEQAPFARG